MPAHTSESEDYFAAEMLRKEATCLAKAPHSSSHRYAKQQAKKTARRPTVKLDPTCHIQKAQCTQCAYVLYDRLEITTMPARDASWQKIIRVLSQDPPSFLTSLPSFLCLSSAVSRVRAFSARKSKEPRLSTGYLVHAMPAKPTQPNASAKALSSRHPV